MKRHHSRNPRSIADGAPKRVARAALAVAMVASALLWATVAPSSADGTTRLELTKTVSTTSVEVGDTMTWTIRWKCASINNTDQCPDASITDTLPGGVTVTNVTPSGGLVADVAVSGNTVTWSLIDGLESGSTGTLAITGTAAFTCLTAPGTIEANRAEFTVGGAVPIVAESAAVTVAANADTCEPAPPSNELVKIETSGRVVEGGQIRWQINLPSRDTGYTVIDVWPSSKIYLADIYSNWVFLQQATEVSCDGGSTWSTFPRPWTADASMWTPGAACRLGPAPDGSGIPVISSTADEPLQFRLEVPRNRAVTWVFAGKLDDSFEPAEGRLQNCVVADAPDVGSACTTSSVSDRVPGPRMVKSLSGSTAQPLFFDADHDGTFDAGEPTLPEPGDNFTQGPSDLAYTLAASNYRTGGVDLVDPVISDLLPPELSYVAPPEGTNFWKVMAQDNAKTPAEQRLDAQPGCLSPSFEAVDDFAGTGRTLLRWSFDGCVLYHAQVESTVLNVVFSARMSAGLEGGTTISNQASLGDRGPDIDYNTATCDQADGGVVVDVDDRDGDADDTDARCDSQVVTVKVPEAAMLDSSKWVTGALDTEPSRFPQVGRTSGDADGLGHYDFYLENLGNATTDRVAVADILPSSGDHMVLARSVLRGPNGAGSEWAMKLADEVVVDYLPRAKTRPGTARQQDWSQAEPLRGSDVTISYGASARPCYLRGDDLDASGDGPAGCAPDGFASNAAGARSFIIVIDQDLEPYSQDLGHGAMIRIQAEAVGDPTPPAGQRDGLVAWNSFAVQPTTASGLKLLATEPLQVGIRLSDQPSTPSTTAPGATSTVPVGTPSSVEPQPPIEATSTVPGAVATPTTASSSPAPPSGNGSPPSDNAGPPSANAAGPQGVAASPAVAGATQGPLARTGTSSALALLALAAVVAGAAMLAATRGHRQRRP
ncbi:MAG: hypothetical protein R2754_05725 [Microthrixaceae bacterium]